jgi:ferredoxin--NADP+ reductase
MESTPLPLPAAAPPAATAPARATVERILAIHRWTDRLLSFRCTRDPALHFVPGLYARLGLGDGRGEGDVAGAPGMLWRPFSMVSAPDEPALEFVATLVEGGAFSERLARCTVGDPIGVETAAFGFLTLAQLAAGRDLWLLASGTGLGPFVSMLRDERAWRSFEHIVLVHSVRRAADLAYRDEILALAAARPAPGTPARAVLRYLPVVTREAVPGALGERIPALLQDGRLEAEAGLTLEAGQARAMVCGHPELTVAMRAALTQRGFRTSRRGVPGQMAFEKYW